MATQKIYIHEFEESDYEVIAIHTTLEDSRLAYHINRQLEVLLARSEEDLQIQVKDGLTGLSRFEFYDEAQFITWNLVQNKSEIANVTSGTGDLFASLQEEIATTVYLLPEFKKVDYLLKIENLEDDLDVEVLVKKISDIEWVSLAYCIDKDKLKSKHNLIF
ncbi:IPExxxVDY family protein [Flavobacterium sp. N1719]|uniref:IPExxxVDY family protein n=1 Tax=Flavobacterium sp. N1719 TaxID=2885633 RepID=UPI002223ADAA|nr:IPExxxVDY family protein [Flavobacterium sp. N1719]